MTHRERFITSIERCSPDRIPVGKVDFCGSLLKVFKEKTGAHDPNEYFNIPTRLVGGWASGAGGAMVGGTHMWKGDIDYSAYLLPIEPDGRLMCKGDGYLIGEDDMEVYLFPLKSMQSLDELYEYPWWEAERNAAASRDWRELKGIVDKLKEIAPEGVTFNTSFEEIFKDGTGKKFEMNHNREWMKHTRPMLEAFFHAKYFLEMAVRYGKKLDKAPNCLPFGWAALLYFYNLR